MSILRELLDGFCTVEAPFVCWKVVFFWKVNSGKVNYFLMFGSVMENKLENIFQCLVMSWKNELENNLLIFYFSQVY